MNSLKKTIETLRHQQLGNSVAVDFDGTLVENCWPNIGKPIPYAFETCKMLQLIGVYTILWTCRNGIQLDEAVLCCKANHYEPAAVNDAIPFDKARGFNSRKICAGWYIDDKTLNGHQDMKKFWKKMYKIVKKIYDLEVKRGRIHIDWINNCNSNIGSNVCKKSV